LGADHHLRLHAAGTRKAGDRGEHPRVDQRVGQEEHRVVGADREHPSHVVHGLEPLLGEHGLVGVLRRHAPPGGERVAHGLLPVRWIATYWAVMPSLRISRP
ncbi:MAG: hypothetical protein ACK559_04140, partial [bacterium]